MSMVVLTWQAEAITIQRTVLHYRSCDLKNTFFFDYYAIKSGTVCRRTSDSPTSHAAVLESLKTFSFGPQWDQSVEWTCLTALWKIKVNLYSTTSRICCLGCACITDRDSIQPRPAVQACTHGLWPTATQPHVAPVCRCFGLHPCNPCRYVDYYSFTNPRGMQGWVGINFRNILTNLYIKKSQHRTKQYSNPVLHHTLGVGQPPAWTATITKALQQRWMMKHPDNDWHCQYNGRLMNVALQENHQPVKANHAVHVLTESAAHITTRLLFNDHVSTITPDWPITGHKFGVWPIYNISSDSTISFGLGNKKTENL